MDSFIIHSPCHQRWVKYQQTILNLQVFCKTAVCHLHDIYTQVIAASLNQ